MTEQAENIEDVQTHETEQAADEQISDDQLLDELDDDVADATATDTEGPDATAAEELDDDADVDQDESGDDLDDDTGVDQDDSDDDGTPADAVTDMESVVEAILFASDETLTAARLVSVVETGSVKQIRQSVKNLNKKYAAGNCAFRIEEIAGGYQMMTLPPYNHWLKKLLRVRTDSKLTQAALEALAIIAYKQPIIRADVEAIRGVASGEVIRNLMYKGLVKIVGRADVLGRPMLYGTTRKFLDVFGLNSLKDLPKVEELKKPEE
jgi:segregation and condensation protein B